MKPRLRQLGAESAFEAPGQSLRAGALKNGGLLIPGTYLMPGI